MQAKSPGPETPAAEDTSPLTISPETVCFIILKAREFDVKDAVTEPDPASNPSDDRDAAVLEDHSDDPVVEELTSLINALSEDEQIDLVTLTWLGYWRCNDCQLGTGTIGPPGAGSTRAGRCMSAGCQRGASDSRRRPKFWTVERQAGAIQRSYLSAGWIG